jgi:hypothetical protein
VGSATAPAAGREAVLQTVPVSLGGAYTILVSGAAGTTGGYTVQVYLNAAVEAEEHGGPRNDTLATAQDLEPAFLPLTMSADRAAVVGTTDGSSNYTANVVTPTFEDISATGTAVLRGVDDTFVQLTSAQLGGFTFTFYTQTYNTLFVSSNGLITFGSGNSEYTNQNLTNDPSQATISPFWDDLVTFDASSAVYWQVVGVGPSQHLVIQWNHVQFYTGGRMPSLTFEAVLNADGSIQFNYQSLSASTPGSDEGASATVGVKDAGTQGPNRLLLAFNDGPNQYVGSNKSTLILPPGPTTADFYSFHLNAGQTATAALKVLTTANVTLELEDADGTSLAIGRTGATNLDRVLNNFVAPADGVYYLRVIGATGADGHKDYSLVVTRNADFDTEPNNTLATAQDISGTAGALGHVGGAGNADDYYGVNAVARETLSFQTRTPGDGPGGFGNVLAPHLELYDPSGTLVAAGTVLPDGRNEVLTYTVLDGADGRYVVHVIAQGGTHGEYVLDYQTSFSPSPPRRSPRAPGTSLPPSYALTPSNEPPPELALTLGEAVGIGGPQSVPGFGRIVSTEVVPEAELWESADIRSRQIVDEVFATELKMNADLDGLLATQLGQSIPKRKSHDFRL